MTLPIGRKPSRSGFTLIELILLTIIIAVLVAASTPQFRRTFSALKLREASYNLAKLINFAQEKAIVEGIPYKLVLDPQDGRYYFLRFDDIKKKGYVRLKDRLGKVFTVPQGARLKTNKREIIFYPDGRSQKATITISRRKRHIKILLKGKLGYVDITLDEKK